MTKISLQTALGYDAKFVDEDSAAAIESLPVEAWPALVQAWSDYNGPDQQPGIDCTVAVTHETLADFDDSRARFWNEKGSREELEIGGFKAIKYERFQLRRGDTRRACQIVIDFGDLRAALI